MTDRISVHAIVEGRVQGVWYRGWTVRTATDLGLDGWVRNRTDGTVEAVFAGPADRVAEMLKACRSGPEAAAVRDIVRAVGADPGEGSGFHRRPTA